MKKPWLSTINFIVISFLLFLSCGLQTTFWYQVFGDLPAPLLWLIFIIYLALFRKPVSGLVSIYAFGFFAASYSGMPLKMMFTTTLILFSLVYIIKNRIFWTGAGYFTIMCTFGTFAYQIIYLITSHILESNPSNLMLLTRITQVILTPIFGYFLYFPLAYLDRLTVDNVTTESGGLEA